MKYNTAATILYQYALLCEGDSGKSNNLAAFFCTVVFRYTGS